MIDLDANASTSVAPEVLDAMLPWLRNGHANPSASHRGGREARKAIEYAREQVACLLHASPDEIVFTSGGTESINAAIQSLHHLTRPGAALTSAIEHSAVLRTISSLDRESRFCPPDDSGCVDPAAFQSLVPGAAFASVMLANNETGAIQPVATLSDLCHEAGIPMHTDAVQAAGKIPIHVGTLGADLLSISAHKFHGPKGVGALYIRSGLDFVPLLHGGGQESARRAGTENTAGIVGLGQAAQLAGQHLAGFGASIRNHFEARIRELIPNCTFNGDPDRRLPNTSHVSFAGCDAAAMLILLDEAGLACSAGSSCMTGSRKPSHVQLAMGIPEERAKTSLRFSFSRYHSLEDADRAAEIVVRAAAKLRSVQGGSVGPVTVYSPP